MLTIVRWRSIHGPFPSVEPCASFANVRRSLPESGHLGGTDWGHQAGFGGMFRWHLPASAMGRSPTASVGRPHWT